MRHGKLTRFQYLITLTLNWLLWTTKPIIIHHVKWMCTVTYSQFSPYSYAEVRAEQRRELGIEESQPEMTAEKVRMFQDAVGISVILGLTCPHTITAIPGFRFRVPAQHLQPEGGSRPLQPQSDAFGVIPQLTQILSHRGVWPHM